MTLFVETSAVDWNVVVVDACLFMPCAMIFHFAALCCSGRFVARQFASSIDANIEGPNVFAAWLFLTIGRICVRGALHFHASPFVSFPCATQVFLEHFARLVVWKIAAFFGFLDTLPKFVCATVRLTFLLSFNGTAFGAIVVVRNVQPPGLRHKLSCVRLQFLVSSTRFEGFVREFESLEFFFHEVSVSQVAHVSNLIKRQSKV